MVGPPRNEQSSQSPLRQNGSYAAQSSSAAERVPQIYQPSVHILNAWSPVLERTTILVVDDEPSIAQLLCDVLDDAGYRVLLAMDGRSALATARRERPALVLTDRMLPELDGMEVARQLRRNPVTCHIPVVVMSSSRPDRELMGDIPFLPKPFELDELLDTVATYVRGNAGVEE